ncbi:hypothetical protein NFK58_15830 [Citrobacter portucalensis]|uniref:hypothetical protein n=1 Tax=Citrobacter portucalensis TaxID=1639133 RepID=UPI0015EA41C0|nr:hypothetical protein [Citrobacter portucalensis]MBA8419171.1 hypothetical protein [Citrobacter freundii]MDE9612436.1 hypothetical protein [Citrobacter portucalensis]QMM95727.1 hypothetical protein HVW92_15685 [Citrobacter freundii]WFZ22739.1 hypothetical protein NFK58_15830 [Citrobacter portucalensis]
MKTENLLNVLNEIIIELKNNGKKQSADFFSLRYNNIKNLNNHLESIEELSTCRAMAQYANFSITEERKLDKIVDYATAILAGDKA